MAEIAKNSAITSPGPSTVLFPDSNKLPPAPIGEDIGGGDACYIAADGKIYRSDGTASGVVGGSAEVDGFAPQPAKLASRQSLSLVHDVNLDYGIGLTPGIFLYLSTLTKGALTNVVGTKQVAPIARTFDATRIRVLRTY